MGDGKVTLHPSGHKVILPPSAHVSSTSTCHMSFSSLYFFFFFSFFFLRLSSLSLSCFLCFRSRFLSRSSSLRSSWAGVSLPRNFRFFAFFLSLPCTWLRTALYCSGNGPGCSLKPFS